MPYVVSPEAMRRYDARCISREKITSYALMERAGTRLADALVSKPWFAAREAAQILIVCGPGNNGGDGLVIGRVLALKGYAVTCAVLAAHEASDDNRNAQQALDATSAKRMHVNEVHELNPLIDKANVLIDAVFGIGLDRAPTGLYAEAIHAINQRDATRIAIDIPSGLHGDTGVAFDPCIKADYTLVVEALKRGNLMHDALDVSGLIDVVDVGIDCSGASESFTRANALHGAIPLRPHHSHKYQHGVVQIIGGSYDMPGAPALAAHAAYAAGAGLVIVSTSRPVRDMLRNVPAEAIFATIPDNGIPSIERADAFVIGPGLLASPSARATLRATLQHDAPTVVDGGALAMFIEGVQEKANKPVVLTPHAGEMAMLSGVDSDAFRQDWYRFAREVAEEHRVHVLYKGPCSVLIGPDGSARYMLAGNPGLAKAGSGDVLAGILGVFLAQGYAIDKAVGLAVYVHGMAADVSAASRGEASVMASDVIAALPEAIKLFSKDATRPANFL